MGKELEKILAEMCIEHHFSMRPPIVAPANENLFQVTILVDIDSVRVFTISASDTTIDDAKKTALEKMISRINHELEKRVRRMEVCDETIYIRALMELASKSGLQPLYVTRQNENGFITKCCYIYHGTSLEVTGKLMPTELQAENESSRLLLHRLNYVG